eukprot:2020609-Rhodomonas_salina.2
MSCCIPKGAFAVWCCRMLMPTGQTEEHPTEVRPGSVERQRRMPSDSLRPAEKGIPWMHPTLSWQRLYAMLGEDRPHGGGRHRTMASHVHSGTIHGVVHPRRLNRARMVKSHAQHTTVSEA